MRSRSIEHYQLRALAFIAQDSFSKTGLGWFLQLHGYQLFGTLAVVVNTIL